MFDGLAEGLRHAGHCVASERVGCQLSFIGRDDAAVVAPVRVSSVLKMVQSRWSFFVA
jgi:hypothetical protein